MRDTGMTLQAIGDEVGVTRERVRQVLVRHYGTAKPTMDLMTRLKVAKLIGCSEGRLAYLEQKGMLEPIKHPGSVIHYYDQEEFKKALKVIIEEEARHIPVTLTCGNCKKDFTLSRSEFNARNRRKKIPMFFCSRSCYGAYFGNHYGFGVHPENSAFGCYKKWDYDKDFALWESTHCTQRYISETLGLPLVSVSKILKTFPAYVNRPRELRRAKTPKDYGERECIGCGAPIPRERRGIWCSTECYNRLKALYRCTVGVAERIPWRFARTKPTLSVPVVRPRM
jgi:hypothetical protein